MLSIQSILQILSKMNNAKHFSGNKYHKRKILILCSLFKSTEIKKRALIGFLFILQTSCAMAPANHQEDDWFSEDKYAHFVLSGITSAVIARAAKEDGRQNCEAALIGLTVTLSLGAAKESYDKRHKKTLYSFQDMSWNLLGSTLGSLAGSNCR